LRSYPTKFAFPPESVKNTGSKLNPHRIDPNPKIGATPGPKATKTDPPYDKVTHQGTTITKACFVGGSPSEKAREKVDKGSLQRIYLFSKAKASQKQI
jgi:hypothetical protein